MLVLPRKRSVIQLFESQYFYDSVCGDLRAHFGGLNFMKTPITSEERS